MRTQNYDEPDGSSSWAWDPQEPLPCSTPWGGGTIMGTTLRRGAYAGEETPHFHERLARGEILPLNNYSRWDYRWKGLPGSVNLTYVGSCAGVTHTAGVSAARITSALSRLVSPVDNELHPNLQAAMAADDVDRDALLIAAMADMLPDLDALTTAVEAHKTFKMIKNVRRDASHLIRQAMRGGYHTAKAAGDAWLSWRYGWRILGFDIENISEFIANPIAYRVVKGSATETSVSTWTANSTVPGGAYTTTSEAEYTANVSIRAKTVGIVRATTLNTFYDMPLTIWETIPFSFVADWFVNVGSVLAAWKVSRNVDSLHTSLGRKVEATERHSVNLSPGTDTVTFPAASGSAQGFGSYIARSRDRAWIPSFIPSVQVKLNSAKIADLAALLAKPLLSR